MSDSTLQVVALIANVFALAFMIGSGLWVFFDAKNKGQSMQESLVWGLFTACFFLLGLIVYLFWRKKFFSP